MPILLALSILAFVALLWAAISIAGFVRRARRRRRRRAAEVEPSGITVPVDGAHAVYYTDLQADPVQPRTPEPAAVTSPDDLETVVAPAEREAVAAPASPPTSAAEPLPPPVPEPPPPPRLRSFPTRIGKHTLAAVGSEGAWPKLVSAGAEYGDLSDPAPSRRRDELRSRNNVRTR